MDASMINAVGDGVFRLKQSSSRHMAGLDEPAEEKGKGSFASLLGSSLEEVNKAQITYSDLVQKALVDPESVNAHDITIAGAEASLALNITKNVVDRVINAYKEITSLR